MKKILIALSLIIAIVALCVLSACRPADEPFVNPGDKLGGGGVGDVANNVDTSNTEDGIDKVITDIKPDDAQAGQTPDNAVTPDAVENVVTITESGAYTLSGSYNQIVIDGNGLEVQLILNNAVINNSNGVAIDGTSKGKKLSVTLTAPSGTVNAITNNGDDVNAVHIKGSLTVNGEGSLTVTSASKSALKASKGIIIIQSNLTLTAANHAVTGSTVVATNCTINVLSVGKDGINAECDEATEYVTDDGYVYLNNVNFTCNVDGDGIQADTWLYVDGGTYNVTTVGVFVANTAANMQQYGMTSDDFRFVKSGSTYQKIGADEANRYSSRYGLAQSAKGFKVGEIEYTDKATNKEITVTDGDYCIKLVSGSFTFNCSDDAIHTNSGDVIISGGTYQITTLDDGITADGTTKITDGNIQIIKSYEGIEGAYVEISGGTINLVSTDDGINAASDDTKITEHIIISGGNVTVDASGDGLDSNGSILISGGNVVVHGPTTGGDAGLDADRGIVVNGGTLFACSSLGMVETPSTNSAQYVVSYAQQTAIAAGTVLTITDEENNALYTVTTTKACQSVIISIPNLAKGKTYSVCGNGSTLATFTVSSVITTIGSSGGMGGGRPGGGWGGRPGGR